MKRRDLIIVTVFGIVNLFLNGFAIAWEYPEIKDYGAIQPFPDAALKPDKALKYRVIFDVTRQSKEKNKVNPGLDQVARFINVMASVGIKPKDMDLIAVIHGRATPVVLENVMFRMKYLVDNPNLKLLQGLKKAGVKLYVCGQALAERKLSRNWVHPEINIALSAVEVISTFQLKGYICVPSS